MCASKGFDAVELDDIDSFDPPSTTGFHLTPGDAQNFLACADNEIHRHGMTVLWKNSAAAQLVGPPLHRRRGRGGVLRLRRVLLGQAGRDERTSASRAPRLAGRARRAAGTTSPPTHPGQPTGKWVGEAEYGDDDFVCDPGTGLPRAGTRYAAYCNAVYAPANGFSALRMTAELDGTLFEPCPSGV